MAAFNFENLMVWQKAHQFVLAVYSATRSFPKEELFALTSQFRRAAVSIEANIAEGYKKLSKAGKLRFLNIAEGSLEECRDYILLSRDLTYISNDQFTLLSNSSEETAKLPIAYSKGIINNNGIKD